MSATALIRQAQADGVVLALSPTGTLLAVGDGEAIRRWLPIIREHKSELLEALRKTPEEREILQWLSCIGETDPATIRETLGKCSDDPDALRFFLALARGEDVGVAH